VRGSQFESRRYHHAVPRKDGFLRPSELFLTFMALGVQGCEESQSLSRGNCCGDI
jgi:hypothetical protein